MKKIKYNDVKKLRDAGLTFAQIGKVLGIHKGVAYRILKKGVGYSEKVGNKRNMRKRKIFPIWEVRGINAKLLYQEIPNLVARWCSILNLPQLTQLELTDYILDFLYSRNREYWKQFRNPRGFIFARARKIVVCWASYLNSEAKRTIEEKAGLPYWIGAENRSKFTANPKEVKNVCELNPVANSNI